MINKIKGFFLLSLFFYISVSGVFAQRMPAVGILPFEATSGGVSAADADNLTRRVIAELNSWGTLNVVQGTEGAEFIVRGTFFRQTGTFILAAETIDARTNRVLNEFREQAQTPGNISIVSFCAKLVERVPLPNYLLGTWQATITMPDGPVVCIIEFRSDRTARVERYDTWEHRQNNALRYEGYGTGTYTYAGFAHRSINVNAQPVRIDAMIGVSLTLEETLPEQTNVNQTGLGIVFNSDRTAFDIVNGSLPCGRNFDGPSVYHSATLGFTRFTKIR
jgi:hypothetical protein